MNNTEISETLCISVGTTKAHIHNIFAKVDIKRRRDLMQIYEKLVDCLEKCLIYRHIRRFAD